MGRYEHQLGAEATAVEMKTKTSQSPFSQSFAEYIQSEYAQNGAHIGCTKFTIQHGLFGLSKEQERFAMRDEEPIERWSPLP